MLPCSEAFKRVVQRPHTSVGRLDVVENGVVLASLYPHSGDVTVDRYSQIRSRLSCRVADPKRRLTPLGMRDLLAPFGRLLKLFSGVLIPGVEHVTNRVDTQAGWTACTRVGTVAASDGALVLGTSSP